MRTALKGRIRIPEKSDVRELVFAKRFEFPTDGDPLKLYIATDEDAIYRYDSIKAIYVQLTTSVDGQIIDGGDSISDETIIFDGGDSHG